MFERIVHNAAIFASACLKIGKEAVDGTSITHFGSLDSSIKKNILGRILLVAFKAGLIAWLVSLNPLLIAIPAGIIAFAYYTNRDWIPSPFIEAILGREVVRILEERRLKQEIKQQREDFRQDWVQGRVQRMLDLEKDRGELEEMIEDPTLTPDERKLCQLISQNHDDEMSALVFQ